jgi:hypothetical protein
MDPLSSRPLSAQNVAVAAALAVTCGLHLADGFGVMPPVVGGLLLGGWLGAAGARQPAVS